MLLRNPGVALRIIIALVCDAWCGCQIDFFVEAFGVISLFFSSSGIQERICPFPFHTFNSYYSLEPNLYYVFTLLGLVGRRFEGTQLKIG